MLLAALDQTIVATALPTITGDLYGLNHITPQGLAHLPVPLKHVITAAFAGFTSRNHARAPNCPPAGEPRPSTIRSSS